MKSTQKQLENRGFITDGAVKKYLDSTFEQRLILLRSNLPTDRTLAARLLAKNSNLQAIDFLIEALINEIKLYTKIEICNSLVSYGKDAVIPLIGLLGVIGNNQHKTVPGSDFKKDNFPLPRDLAGRILIRIGPIAIPDLVKILGSRDLKKLSETIDTIGYICFYEYQVNVFGILKECFNHNVDNDLIKWKIFRAMSAFPESESFLREQQHLHNGQLKREIDRSLLLIKKRIIKTIVKERISKEG